MAKIDVLIEGYKRFYNKHFLNNKEIYNELATKGQTPKTLVIGCSDSRVDPSILTDSGPGDIFVIRNVANLVPPYQPDKESCHGTSVSVEFAIKNLNVEHIIILGHSGCAGVKTLFESNEEENEPQEFSFISAWVNIAKDAKIRTIEKCKNSTENTYNICEKENIITSLGNLLTFPWIKEKIDNNEIELHGWYFSLDDGSLYNLDQNNNFTKI